MGLLDKLNRDDDESKRKADFSNVRSGSSSTAPDSEVEQRPASESTTTYTVVAGDSLSKIALREYGNANEWKRIYEANRHIIKDPDLIYPGQELSIPNSSGEV